MAPHPGGSGYRRRDDLILDSSHFPLGAWIIILGARCTGATEDDVNVEDPFD